MTTRTRTKRVPIEKRRHADVADVLHAVTSDSLVSLFVKRKVTAAVAAGALEKLRELMGEHAFENPRLAPLISHLAQAQARGDSPKKLRQPRVVGEVIDYTSQKRRENSARFLVIPLSVLGNPENCSVAFGADRIIVGRKGEVSAAEVGVAPAASPAEVLEELQRRTGVALARDAMKAGIMGGKS